MHSSNIEYPWPDDEHIDASVTTADRVHEEMHYDGTGTELRKRVLIELTAIYQRSRLLESLTAFNRTLQKARANGVSTGTFHEGYDGDDLWAAAELGILVGLHTTVQAYPESLRRALYAQPTEFIGINYYDNGTEMHDYLMSTAAATEGLFDAYFDELPEELQEAIMEFANAAYIDCSYPQRSAYENEFLLNYMIAHRLIVSLVEDDGGLGNVTYAA